jgi:hypothetical protein
LALLPNQQRRKSGRFHRANLIEPTIEATAREVIDPGGETDHDR